MSFPDSQVWDLEGWVFAPSPGIDEAILQCLFRMARHSRQIRITLDDYRRIYFIHTNTEEEKCQVIIDLYVNDTIASTIIDLYVNDIIASTIIDLYVNDTIASTIIDLYVNDTIASTIIDLYVNDTIASTSAVITSPDFVLSVTSLRNLQGVIVLARPRPVLKVVKDIFNPTKLQYRSFRRAYLFAVREAFGSMVENSHYEMLVAELRRRNASALHYHNYRGRERHWFGRSKTFVPIAFQVGELQGGDDEIGGSSDSREPVATMAVLSSVGSDDDDDDNDGAGGTVNNNSNNNSNSNDIPIAAIATNNNDDDDDADVEDDGRARIFWDRTKTMSLLTGLARHGLGKWTRIFNDQTLQFRKTSRIPRDLEIRFRALCRVNVISVRGRGRSRTFTTNNEALETFLQGIQRDDATRRNNNNATPINIRAASNGFTNNGTADAVVTHAPRRVLPDVVIESRPTITKWREIIQFTRSQFGENGVAAIERVRPFLDPEATRRRSWADLYRLLNMSTRRTMSSREWSRLADNLCRLRLLVELSVRPRLLVVRHSTNNE